MSTAPSLRPSSFFKGSRPVMQRRAQAHQPSRQLRVQAQALFGGGGRTKAPKTAYICKDCGYIYDERTPFEDQDKSYRCPVCNAPKRRFTVYNAPVAKGANSTSVRKERKAELQSGGGGGVNPGIVIGIGAAIVVGAFLYLNSQY